MATNKNLPIKFFQKRQKDERDSEGSGGPMPSWADSSTIGSKAAYFQQVLSNVQNVLEQKVKRNSYIPSVVKLKINDLERYSMSAN